MSAMSIETEDELEGLRRAGRVVAEVLRELRRRVQPGVTTLELDQLAGRVFARHGAPSAPRLVYGAPSEVFISVNDAAVHGLPSRRRLRRGDVVKVDVTAELDGFYADACTTVVAWSASPGAHRLISAADAALRRGLGDGWTIRTADGALAAHTEHTIVVTDGRPLVLTA
jgi:methionyl aminopeptidase